MGEPSWATLNARMSGFHKQVAHSTGNTEGTEEEESKQRREESSKGNINIMEEIMSYRIWNKEWSNTSDLNIKLCQLYLTYCVRGTMTNGNIGEYEKKNLNHRFTRHQRWEISIFTKIKKQQSSFRVNGTI